MDHQGPEVTVSRSSVAKTLKKDLGAIEKRLARFRMDTVLPGTSRTSNRLRWCSVC